VTAAAAPSAIAFKLSGLLHPPSAFDLRRQQIDDRPRRAGGAHGRMPGDQLKPDSPASAMVGM